MTVHYDDGTVRILHGDCRDLLPGLHADVVVTDPPYDLAFMGRSWDKLPTGFHQAWARAALPALPQGGWLLAFGGTRTWHRLACGLEDAGFELRDTIVWLHGQGFPKSKAGLKPGWEPVIVARKPGSSVLQIDAGRIGTAEEWPGDSRPSASLNGFGPGDADGWEGNWTKRSASHDAGRWPPNVAIVHSDGCQQVGTRKVRASGGVIGGAPTGGWPPGIGGNRRPVDPDGTETITAWACEEGCPVALLDQQSGDTRSQRTEHRGRGWSSEGSHEGWRRPAHQQYQSSGGYDDKGGASRFYFTAKASRAERVTVDGERHPTVKPLALMRWLVRLVTPPGGTILDPFCGSGSTLVAAAMEGFTAVGIEADEKWCRGSAQRVANRPPVQEALAL